MPDHAKEFAKTALARSLRTARGSASPEAKEHIAQWFGSRANSRQFLYPVISRMVATDVDMIGIPDVPGKFQGRIVFELDVREDMCNILTSLHGGCSATLIDTCTAFTIKLTAFYAAPGGNEHISLALNTTYHSPAPLGARLKVVCTTVAFGGRVVTAKAEIYDKTHGRLVATGIHIQMIMTSPPPPPKL